MPTDSRASTVKIEICTNSVQSALAAQAGGADSVELCENLAEGGTTPGYGAISQTREALTIALYPIIRPRGGDFLYDTLDFEIMKKDIAICKQLGCDGVVFGILTADGKIDRERCKILAEIAGDMQLTFHRAFDLAVDPWEALEEIIDLGFKRILTSGGRNTAEEGASLIQQLVMKAEGRISIVAGSGVGVNNIAWLAEITRAKAFHARATRRIPSQMKFHKLHMTMGHQPMDLGCDVTDADLVRQIRDIAERILDQH